MASKGGLVKLLRVALYAISVPGVAVGAGLTRASLSSAAFADGTAEAKFANGMVLFWVFGVILGINIIFGMVRWFERASLERWKAGRIVGKIIGGGIWRVLVFTPVIVGSLLVLAPKMGQRISENVSAVASEFTPVNPDEGVERVRELGIKMGVIAEEGALDGGVSEVKISKEEFLREFEEAFLGNVEFDTDASGNAIGAKTPFFDNVSAASTSIKTLNKAVRSSERNFVVFYTDTGEDAISEEAAKGLAEMLEEIIVGYREILGLEYKYEKFGGGFLKEGAMEKVLSANHLPTNALERSMPVYVVNPYSGETNTYATYAGRRFLEFGTKMLMRAGEVFGVEEAKLYNTAPTFPFINITPRNIGTEDLKIVTAHELGHHFIANWSYENYGGIGSDDDFIDETAPNFFAINVVSGAAQGLVNKNHYNKAYLGMGGFSKTVSTAIPEFLGYPAVAFLQNYYEVVPGVMGKILEAAYRGGALDYLAEAAGDSDFQRVMVRLAERNLTGDYNGKLTNLQIPEGRVAPCVDLCSENYTVAPAATEYVYFSAADYAGTEVGFTGGDSTVASLVARNRDGKWEILESGKEGISFEIDALAAERYGLIAFAVSNASVDSTGRFKVMVTKAEIADLVSEDGEFDLGEAEECFEFDTSDFAELIGSAEGAMYRVMVCGNYIRKGSSFEEVKAKLSEALGFSISVFDTEEGGVRWSGIAGIDLLGGQARAYVLGERGGEMGLITIYVNKK